MDTDIISGLEAGLRSILVLSGSTGDRVVGGALVTTPPRCLHTVVMVSLRSSYFFFCAFGSPCQ